MNCNIVIASKQPRLSHSGSTCANVSLVYMNALPVESVICFQTAIWGSEAISEALQYDTFCEAASVSTGCFTCVHAAGSERVRLLLLSLGSWEITAY